MKQRQSNSQSAEVQNSNSCLYKLDTRQLPVMVGTLRILLFLATVTQLLLALISAKSIVPSHHQAEFVDYLKKYGYVRQADPRLGEINTDKDIREGVKKIQRLFKLPANGDLSDPQTVAIMHKKRCGMPDFGPSDNARRKRRYATQGTEWWKKDLTYKIVNYTPDLTKEQVDQTLAKAFNAWANPSSLTFRKIIDSDKEADILIRFVRGYHGDSRPADGKGKELAHAFFPLDNKGLSGDVHFDEDETFTLLNVAKDGVDLEWLSKHELGHSLGLDHTYHPDSIMFPFYPLDYIPDPQLDADDINGIQSIYGMPSIERVTPTPHTQATPAPGLPDKCSAKVDTIVTTQDKTTLLFSGEYFWEIGIYGASEAKKIKDVFLDLEENIDAAYTSRKEGHTVFFKGASFWLYENRKHVYGPASIEELGLPSELENMDAALEWNRNGKTYFFKGDKYWRFDPIRKSMDSGYPRNLGAWRGIPESNIDGAFQWENGKTYFFKGKDYYSFDDRKVRVNPGYPRDVATYWMGCGSNGNVKLARLNSGFSTAPSFVLFAVTLVLAWLF